MTLIGTDVLDTLGMFDGDGRPARAGRRRRSRPAGLDGPARPGRDRERRRARHGRQRHRRRHPVAVAGPFMPVPVVVVKGYEPPVLRRRRTLVFAVSFSGDTEETVEAATRPRSRAPASWPSPGAASSAGWPRAWGAPVRAGPRRHPPAPGRPRRPGDPAAVVLEEIGLFPRRAQWIDHAVDQLRPRRDALLADGNPAAGLARRIGRTIPLSTAAAPSGHGRRRAGRPRSTRTPRRRRSANAYPSSATTRSRLGPARRRHPPGLHAGATSATTTSTRRSRRRFEPRPRARGRGRGRRRRGAGRGRGPAGPAARPGPGRRLRVAPPGRRRRASTPGPVPVLDEIKAALEDVAPAVPRPAGRRRFPAPTCRPRLGDPRARMRTP